MMMQLWLGLVAGVIIGWVIEWVIDWQFWRRDVNTIVDTETKMRTQLVDANKEITRLQGQLADQNSSQEDLLQAQKEIRQLREQLEQLSK